MLGFNPQLSAIENRARDLRAQRLREIFSVFRKH